MDANVGDQQDQRPVAQVEALIQTNNLEDLEQFVRNLVPSNPDGSHPSMVHPFLFLVIWRRRVMDLIDGGHHEEATRIFAEKIFPMRDTITAYAYSKKLRDEISKIGTAVDLQMSEHHPHCGIELMKKLVNDYLRLYLPHSIGYVPPKGWSAMWEFAFRLDIPVPRVKRHPDIRCLVCSVEKYTKCNVGTKMKAHLRVCPGMTPEAKRRFNEALQKEESKKRGHDLDDDSDNLSTNKTLKVSDPVHLMYQQMDEGNGVLDGMGRITQEQDVAQGIEVMKGIMGRIREFAALALQQQTPPAAQIPQAPQAPGPLQGPQAPPQPVLAPGPGQAPPAQVPVHAPQSPQPVIKAAVPPQVELQGPPAHIPDYYQVFGDFDVLDDLPSLD